MLKTLRLGSEGPEVRSWETFLTGQGFYWIEIDTKFTQETHTATAAWQKEHGLTADGIVGAKSYAEALKLGYPGVEPVTGGPENFPPRPPDAKPLNFQDRQKLWGEITFAPAPTPGNPEGVRITNGWQKDNLSKIVIPQLKGVAGAPGSGSVFWNTKGVAQLTGLFQTWEDKGLINRVLTWAGSWNPRFVRGSRTVLSNHAHATAFDINAQWNGLGVVPAFEGKRGCVRELVTSAYDWGFFWGGWFGASSGTGRYDGMHFELMRLL